MVAAIDTRLTVSQAARCAGVSEQTIRAWLRSGVLRHERTALGRLIDAADLGALIDERERRLRERRTSTGSDGKGRA